MVYVANGSSVLLESVVKKKQTVSLISLSSLPIPAIENNKVKNLYFASNAADLSNIFNTLIAKPNNEIILGGKEKQLYLDDDLKLWKNFLIR